MTLIRTFAIVLALDVLGLVVTLATGAKDLGHALVIGTPINAPFTFVAVQALIVLTATRYRVVAGLRFLICTISVLSGAFDGSYAAELSAAERALQAGLVSLATLRRSVAASPRRTDAVLAGVLATVSLVQVLLFPITSRPAGVVIALVSTLPIALRRRYPLGAALVGISPWLFPTEDGYLVVGYVAIFLLFYSLAV
jgi:hypothetical protein